MEHSHDYPNTRQVTFMDMGNIYHRLTIIKYNKVLCICMTSHWRPGAPLHRALDWLFKYLSGVIKEKCSKPCITLASQCAVCVDSFHCQKNRVQLCIFYKTNRIYLIFIHLINHIQNVSHVELGFLLMLSCFTSRLSASCTRTGLLWMSSYISMSRYRQEFQWFYSVCI